MATTRLLYRSLRLGAPVSKFGTSSVLHQSKHQCSLRLHASGNSERKQASKVSAVAQTHTATTLDLAPVLQNVKNLVVHGLKTITKTRPWKFQLQMLIERVIVDCRFFTLFAVAGSLLGSVLCFVEGFFMVLKSYFQYFNGLPQKSDKGHIVQLLIESIDMFLVGTAMLIFGMALYVMFVGSSNLERKLPTSNLFGLFHLKTIPSWVGIQTISQAKSKIGQAMMMILQVGVLEKFKTIPLITPSDLACFAGAIFISSACVFVLSRLSVSGAVPDR